MPKTAPKTVATPEAPQNDVDQAYQDALNERNGLTLVPAERIAENWTVERVGTAEYNGMAIGKRK